MAFTLILACGGNNTNPASVSEEKAGEVQNAEKHSDIELVNESKSNEEKEYIDQDSESEEKVESLMTEEQLAKSDEIISSVNEDDVESVNTKNLFRMHCAVCHGFKGNMEVNGAKDLTLSRINLRESVAQVYHGKGLMTPYKDVLKDFEIVALSKYIEGLRK